MGKDQTTPMRSSTDTSRAAAATASPAGSVLGAIGDTVALFRREMSPSAQDMALTLAKARLSCGHLDEGMKALPVAGMKIGPLVFGTIFGEDTHDIWLKTLMDYGRLGFVSYLTLILWNGDDEFPPDAQILYDSDITDAFDAEDLAVMGDLFIPRLRAAAVMR